MSNDGFDPTNPNRPGQTPELTDDDAQALDALIEAGYDLDHVPAPMRDRAEHVARLLGLLEAADGPATPDQLLTSRTSSHAPKGANAMAPGVFDPRLTAPDSDALDALVESGWDPSGTPRLFRDRAVRIGALLSLLDPPALDESESSDLAERTFRVVALTRDKERRRRGADSLRVRSRYSLRDIVAVAAMLLITCSIAWPLITNLREGVRSTQCAGNLNAAGLGFTMYANDHKGKLPRKTSPVSQTPSGVWWNVGEGRSISADLFILASEGYCTLGHLGCPGNHAAPTDLDMEEHRDWRSPEEVSFSYLIPGDRSQRWGGAARVVVLSDRSPVIDRARMGERFDPEARSRNHRGRGQNVLFNDGSVTWLIRPVLDNGDNIWLPRSLEGGHDLRLRGVERPSREDDSFVGP